MRSRIREDIRAVKAKDPAARNTLEILLASPGVWAIWMYRIGHWLWRHGAKLLARWLSHAVRRRTGIESLPTFCPRPVESWGGRSPRWSPCWPPR